MDVRAAVAFEAGKPLSIETVQLEGPKAGEVLIEVKATGICHTDAFTLSGDDPEGQFPAILGHEGAGVVADVGPGVTSVKAGDHVIPLWRLSCGQCEYCSDGRPALCAAGTQIRMTGRLLDGSTRFRLDGQELKHFAGVSSFAEYSVVPEAAVLAIPNELPLPSAARFRRAHRR